MTTPEKPIISSEVVRSLDLLHRAIAEVLAARGDIVITDTEVTSP